MAERIEYLDEQAKLYEEQARFEDVSINQVTNFIIEELNSKKFIDKDNLVKLYKVQAKLIAENKILEKSYNLYKQSLELKVQTFGGYENSAVLRSLYNIVRISEERTKYIHAITWITQLLVTLKKKNV